MECSVYIYILSFGGVLGQKFMNLLNLVEFGLLMEGFGGM